MLAGALARIARPDLIYGVRAIDPGFGGLHRVLAIGGVVDPARKREAAGALVVYRCARKGIAQRQSLIRAELPIEFNVVLGITPRCEYRLRDGNDLQVLVERQSVHEGVFRPLADLEIRKERR